MNLQGRYLKSNIHKTHRNISNPPNIEETKRKNSNNSSKNIEKENKQDKKHAYFTEDEKIEIYNNISSKISNNSKTINNIKKIPSNINHFTKPENKSKQDEIFDKINNLKSPSIEKIKQILKSPEKNVNREIKQTNDYNINNNIKPYEIKYENNSNLLNNKKNEINNDYSKFITEKIGLNSEGSIKPKKGDISADSTRKKKEKFNKENDILFDNDELLENSELEEQNNNLSPIIINKSKPLFINPKIQIEKNIGNITEDLSKNNSLSIDRKINSNEIPQNNENKKTTIIDLKAENVELQKSILNNLIYFKSNISSIFYFNFLK